MAFTTNQLTNNNASTTIDLETYSQEPNVARNLFTNSFTSSILQLGNDVRLWRGRGLVALAKLDVYKQKITALALHSLSKGLLWKVDLDIRYPIPHFEPRGFISSDEAVLIKIEAFNRNTDYCVINPNGQQVFSTSNERADAVHLVGKKIFHLPGDWLSREYKLIVHDFEGNENESFTLIRNGVFCHVTTDKWWVRLSAPYNSTTLTIECYEPGGTNPSIRQTTLEMTSSGGSLHNKAHCVADDLLVFSSEEVLGVNPTLYFFDLKKGELVHKVLVGTRREHSFTQASAPSIISEASIQHAISNGIYVVWAEFPLFSFGVVPAKYEIPIKYMSLANLSTLPPDIHTAAVLNSEERDSLSLNLLDSMLTIISFPPIKGVFLKRTCIDLSNGQTADPVIREFNGPTVVNLSEGLLLATTYSGETIVQIEDFTQNAPLQISQITQLLNNITP